MTTFILVRHGQSEANLGKFFAGWMDVELTDRGIKQAECTAEFVTKNYKLDAAYSSDLKRAYTTGKIVAGGLDVIPHTALREIREGKWSGITFDTLEKDFADDYSVWCKDIGNSRCTDGESVRQLCERIMNILTKIAQCNDGKTVLVATHATPIRAVQTYIQTGDLDCMKDIPWVSNASVTELFYDNGDWSLGKIGQDSHLADLISKFPANV